MARAKRNQQEGEQPERKMTGVGKLRELFGLFEQTSKKTAAANGQYGEALKTAQEKNNLNIRAWKKATAWLRGDPDQKWIDMQDMQHYLEVLKFGRNRTADVFEQDEVDRIRGRRGTSAENVVSLAEVGAAEEREQIEGAA
jgi:hypothetical protein